MWKRFVSFLKTLLATIFCAALVNTILLWSSDIFFEFSKLFRRLSSWLQKSPIEIPLLLLIGWIIQQEFRNYREKKKEKDAIKNEKARAAEMKAEEILALEEEYKKIEAKKNKKQGE